MRDDRTLLICQIAWAAVGVVGGFVMAVTAFIGLLFEAAPAKPRDFILPVLFWAALGVCEFLLRRQLKNGSSGSTLAWGVTFGGTGVMIIWCILLLLR